MSAKLPVRERWATWNGHELEAQPPRIVAFDIETPNLKADIGFVLCAIVKPLGEDPVVLRLDELRGDSGKPWDDGRLVATLVDILASAHLAYGWNIRRFDIRFLRTRRLLLGQSQTPRMVATIDLLQVARRFAYTIAPPPSLPAEREEVLRNIASELSQALNRELRLTIDADIINASSGLTLHDVETAALESFATFRDFKVETFTSYKIKILREAGLEFIQPTRGFESVGGYEYLKQYIMNRVIKVLRNPEVAQRYGLGVPKGILLYGPPGTGKTWLARALAKEVGLPMVIIDPSTFLRGIVGETEARVKQVTAIIESLAPIVVFIDEFDQLTLSRQAVVSTDSGVARRMTNMLLSWLGDENRKTFIVGATNYVSDVDPAFLRPGRLDEVIPVFFPDAKAREEILRVHTNVVRRVPLKDVNLGDIVEKTYLWSGAELEKLVLEAASLAMTSDSEYVTQEHFEEAMNAIEVNTAEREKHLKLMIQELKRLENVNRSFLKSALTSFERAEGYRVKGVVV